MTLRKTPSMCCKRQTISLPKPSKLFLGYDQCYCGIGCECVCGGCECVQVRKVEKILTRVDEILKKVRTKQKKS